MQNLGIYKHWFGHTLNFKKQMKVFMYNLKKFLKYYKINVQNKLRNLIKMN